MSKGDSSLCFNPCRVFSGLATPEADGERMGREMFQSLSGFFRPCNRIRPRRFERLNQRFNPCRVFSGLATQAPPLSFLRSSCFNPCRVFSGLATQVSCRLPRVRLRFNPCRVFSGLATPDFSFYSIIILNCFNPCRVFSGLATSPS